MLLDLRQLTEAARRQWDDSDVLRQQQQRRAAIRFNRHDIGLPNAYLNRAIIVKTGIAAEKIERAKSILGDPDGILVNVIAAGTSTAMMARRTAVQQALMGVLGCANTYNRRPGGLDSVIKEDLLLHGYTNLMVLPSGYEAIPNTYDETITDAKERDDDLTDRALHYQQQHPPFTVEWYSAESSRWEFDHDGRACFWSFQSVPVREILTRFRDEHDRPLAKRLQQQMDAQLLTDKDRTVFVTRADREHIQQFIMGGSFAFGIDMQPSRVVHHGDTTILHESAHGMGVVPVALFPGRQSVSERAEDRYVGFLDNALDLFVTLDNLKTQEASVMRQAAWSNPVITIDKAVESVVSAPGVEDPANQTVPLRIEEGEVLRLNPGEDFTQLPWFYPAALEGLSRAIDATARQIDLHTLGITAYGAMSATSGYEQSQLQAANETVLEPYIAGLKHGWSEVCRLVLRAARVLLDSEDFTECDPPITTIPIRHVSDEKVEDVTLTKTMVEMDWDITIDLRTKPIGGVQAQIQTLRLMREAGWIDDYTAMTQLGIRNPEQVQYRNQLAAVVGAPQTQQMIIARSVEAVFAAMQNQSGPSVPPGAVIPSELAALAQDPEMMARMGIGPGAPGGSVSPGGSQPGVPGMDALIGGALGQSNQAGAAGPTAGVFGQPTPPQSAQQNNLTPLPGGQAYGQGQGQPGGFARQPVPSV